MTSKWKRDKWTDTQRVCGTDRVFCHSNSAGLQSTLPQSCTLLGQGVALHRLKQVLTVPCRLLELVHQVVVVVLFEVKLMSHIQDHVSPHQEVVAQGSHLSDRDVDISVHAFPLIHPSFPCRCSVQVDTSCSLYYCLGPPLNVLRRSDVLKVSFL